MGWTEMEKIISGVGQVLISGILVFSFSILLTPGRLRSLGERRVQRPFIFRKILGKQTIANGERFVTAELKEQELRLHNAEAEIEALERQIYSELLAELSGAAQRLRGLAEEIAWLDALLSLAEAAASGRYVRPVIDESTDMERIEAAQIASTASEEFYTDKWGTFLSGYAPIKDAAGNTVAILGVDMDATDVMARQDFIGNTIYIVIGVSVLLAGAIIAGFSRTIIRDIKLLNESAEKISMGNTDVTINVKRGDEIGELADSFSRMVASIKILTMTDQPKAPEKDKKPE